MKYGTLSWTPELDTASAFGAVGVSDFEFPDDEAKIQQVFEKNIPFALNVAKSAGNLAEPRNSGANIPDEYQVKATPAFVVDTFGESYGTPQQVEVNAKRSLGEVTLKYRLNGHGPTYSVPSKELRGGERYGEVRGQYYHRLRATIRDLDVGDTVEVWWQARKEKSESFTFKVVYDAKGTRSGVLLLAAEDYTGNSPGIPYAGPLYLDAHLATLRANGIEPVVYDVDAKGRVAPHPLGVLSHFDAVVWYSGKDLIPRDPTQGPGTASKLAHDEIVGIRDFLNEGGRVFASGQNLPYAHMNGYPYPPGPTAPVPLTDDVFQYYFGAYRYQAGADIDKFAGLPGAAVRQRCSGSRTSRPTRSATRRTRRSSCTRSRSCLARRTRTSPAHRSRSTSSIGKQREEAIEGSFQAYAAHEDETWERLSREIAVPAGTTTFDFQASWDVEQDYDFVIVEVHTVGQDNWTTLPEVGGHAVQTLGSCEIAWNSVHPFVDRYQTFDPATSTCTPSNATTGGAWWGLTGDSAGWNDLHYDLSAYAGQTVEVSISYVTDFAVSGIIGVQVDDVRLTNAGTTTPLTGFETGDLDGFTTPPRSGGQPDPPQHVGGHRHDRPPGRGGRGRGHHRHRHPALRAGADHRHGDPRRHRRRRHALAAAGRREPAAAQRLVAATGSTRSTGPVRTHRPGGPRPFVPRLAQAAGAGEVVGAVAHQAEAHAPAGARGVDVAALAGVDADVPRDAAAEAEEHEVADVQPRRPCAPACRASRARPV